MPDVNIPRPPRPIESGAGVSVHTTADRQLASGHWLLAALPGPGRDRARMEWGQNRETLVPTGTLFSAVKLPGRLLAAVSQDKVPSPGLDEFLLHALAGTPVICDPRSHTYYALLPAALPEMWRRRAVAWPYVGIEWLGRHSYVGVPRPDATQLDPQTYSSYWAVPMAAMGLLGDASAVAQLIADGCHKLAEEVSHAQA